MNQTTKPTLVILAAGMASRYGSMKQTQSFGPSGETIMEYSIYDAIRAGFGKVVFIIREDFAESFKQAIEPKFADKIQIDYVFQSLDKFTEGWAIPETRVKPWGTGHALLCCKGKVNEPFSVINADDFYGRDAFAKAADFLNNECSEQLYSIVGYYLKNTLSENGSVSRGVCEVTADQLLHSIHERTKIYRNEDREVVYEDESGIYPVPADSAVSMNFFCFHPNILALCEEQFQAFLKRNFKDPKAEFFIPFVVNYFINHELGKVKVVPTTAQWFGVTYKEDAPGVQASINQLVASEEYPNNLWA
ncbi:MAG TPA: nucleotidyltransferase [Chitinophagaceae bacterium]|nr:nucleotidyltransferase [Chitinophagaceae bacterium]